MVTSCLKNTFVPKLFQSDLLEIQLIKSLSPESSVHLQPVLKTHHSDLMKELVCFPFRLSTKLISLAMVCQALFATKTTLALRNVRLWAVGINEPYSAAASALSAL